MPYRPRARGVKSRLTKSKLYKIEADTVPSLGLNPAKGQLNPAKGQFYPANGHLNPAKGHLNPAKGQFYPANGHLNPAKGHRIPRRDIESREGTSNPAKGHRIPRRDNFILRRDNALAMDNTTVAQEGEAAAY